jgi:lipoprotein-releasing system permease protein
LNFSLYIAKRYLKSNSKNTAINTINWIASIGIIAGSMALFVVLSVFSGLIDFSLSFTNTIDPDLKIVPKTGKFFDLNPNEAERLYELKDVASYSKTVEERLLFIFDGKQQVANLKGVDTFFTEVSTIDNAVYDGTWIEPGTLQVVVGYGIAQKLSMGLMDFNNDFQVFVPKAGKGEINNPDDAFLTQVLVPIGSYAISEDIDLKYVFCDLPLAQHLLALQKNQLSSIEFTLKPNAEEAKVVQELNTIFKNKVVVKNRVQLNDALYKMLNTENIAVYLIFTLVIIVVLFNLVGALIMMILEKKGNLKTLYNLGAEIKDLKNIFLFQGTLLCFIGALIGLFCGGLIVLAQDSFNFIRITDTLPYPVKLTIKNFLIVLATVNVLGFIASFIAASRINKKLLE